ncbi:hypothetical protein F5148DRAFT_1197546 [Russula earlei]|uniref:Uncharacterized protein n=1 Tax=Russula earlei TaxID=71964 RepID=A0ACC0UB08_9AGAM|nr:hypothetical protein F5148DRAFT_1197546 [Russula earlei]
MDNSFVHPTRMKSIPTGTRKNITPESLIPYDAPIQTCKYRMPSATHQNGVNWSDNEDIE